MLIKYKIISDFFAVVIVSTSLFFSCNSSSTKEKGSSEIKIESGSHNAYFPVSNVNKWQYINEAPREESVIYDVNVESIRTENKNLIAELSTFPFFTNIQEKTKLTLKENGQIYTINKEGKEELFLESAENLKQSDKWKYGEWDANVGSTKEEVITEKGTFKDCIYISYSQYYTFAAELWLAKDVGIVKWGFNRTNPPTLKPLYYVLNNLTLEK
ncbi:MAG: hypothetical protein EHM58_06565 [Ignavibacteriae bacterium]|nr:MAG: hypothetical protein EHM58_06565 [Ignavibacteriota bacterium]